MEVWLLQRWFQQLSSLWLPLCLGLDTVQRGVQAVVLQVLVSGLRVLAVVGAQAVELQVPVSGLQVQAVVVAAVAVVDVVLWSQCSRLQEALDGVQAVEEAWEEGEVGAEARPAEEVGVAEAGEEVVRVVAVLAVAGALGVV